MADCPPLRRFGYLWRNGLVRVLSAALLCEVNAFDLVSSRVVFGDVQSKLLDDVAESCDVDAVQKGNVAQLNPILKDLVNTTFFRIFRVNVEGTCEYWQVESAAEETASDGLAFGADDDEALDRSMTTAEKAMSLERDSEAESGCEFEEDLPTYWADMCSGETSRAGLIEDVNLIKNPERNTGYNGSHIWEAMYSENCFEVGNSLPRGRFRVGQPDMCYEERVLYKLLRGWHTSTSISIFKEFYAPGARKNGVWAPNVEKYMEVLGHKSDRLKHLHFSFVVVLRAIKKAAPFLESYPYTSGDGQDTSTTKALVRRLLDSQVLSLCSPLFEAFDETRLFGSNSPESPEDRILLKRKFKSVFKNITALVDCVQCRRCRLHAKLFSLGLGTALKILLTPPELIASTTARDEVVALINVLWKLSDSMEAAEKLTQIYWQSLGSLATAGKSARPKVVAEEPPLIVPLPPSDTSTSGTLNRLGALDAAMLALKKASASGVLPRQGEEAILRSLVVQAPNEDMLMFAKHYAHHRPELFAVIALEALEGASHAPEMTSSAVSSEPSNGPSVVTTSSLTPTVDAASLAQHSKRAEGIWVALYDQVYDLTEYIDEHPGGPEAILDAAGTNATEIFEAVHNRELLKSTGFEPTGLFVG